MTTQHVESYLDATLPVTERVADLTNDIGGQRFIDDPTDVVGLENFSRKFLAWVHGGFL